MAVEAKIMNIHDSSSAASGTKKVATRKQPYPPSFMETPARNMEAAVGADECPSGAQEWKGNSAVKTNADPPISIRASFMAFFSRAPEPHIPISRYLGITAISRKKKSINRSVAMKKPYAPKPSNVSKT